MTRPALAEHLAPDALDGRGARRPPAHGVVSAHPELGERIPRQPILVVESDRELGRAIAEQLAADGYPVQLARTAQHARVLAGASPPRLALLGKLESSRGTLQLLAEIRESTRADKSWDPALPAIVMGSRQQDLDMLRAFETGADDFLQRPARYLELRARLRAILRRTELEVGRQRLIEVGPLSIDRGARSVRLHGQSVPLRRIEYELLLHMAADPRRVFAKDELLRAVWGYRSIGSTRTVDTHACRLRRKLDVQRTERWVINVWGVGYRLL
jgi:DNA-binding response OmpR family regulator